MGFTMARQAAASSPSTTVTVGAMSNVDESLFSNASA